MRQEATKWKLLCILVVLYTQRMAHQIVLNYMARGAEVVTDSMLKEPVATVFCLHLQRGRKRQVSNLLALDANILEYGYRPAS